MSLSKNNRKLIINYPKDTLGEESKDVSMTVHIDVYIFFFNFNGKDCRLILERFMLHPGFSFSVTDLPENCSNITENTTLASDVTLQQIVQNKTCLWTGIYRMAETESSASVIRIDLIGMKGVDGKENFIAIGEGEDPQNATSVHFNQSYIHLQSDFFLERLNIKHKSIWIQVHQKRINIMFHFNISLVEGSKCIHVFHSMDVRNVVLNPSPHFFE